MPSRWTHPRRIRVTLIGSLVLLAGIVMIVTPGPALIFIPTGLAILATEFAWAKKLLHKIRRATLGERRDPNWLGRQVQKARQSMRGDRKEPTRMDRFLQKMWRFALGPDDLNERPPPPSRDRNHSHSETEADPRAAPERPCRGNR